jgi:hypothetical protein
MKDKPMTAEEALDLITDEMRAGYPQPEDFVWDEEDFVDSNEDKEQVMAEALDEARNDWAHETAQEFCHSHGLDPETWDDYLPLVVYLEGGD